MFVISYLEALLADVAPWAGGVRDDIDLDGLVGGRGGHGAQLLSKGSKHEIVVVVFLLYSLVFLWMKRLRGRLR